ncbi:MAG: triose-phosphate isomerase [bacterium]|nr:triose-phosphate isomerase [bacterium]
MMRRMIIAGNWKMHTDREEAQALAKGVVEKVGGKTEPGVILCPPFPMIPAVKDIIEGTTVQLGAQNVHPEDKGAFTGEISVDILQSVGCNFAIVGHSERRAIFNESDEFINQKVKKVNSSLMIPILCIGETLQEREEGLTFQRVEQQLRDNLNDVVVTTGNDIVVAYEPVWAIGTGKTATPEQAEEVHAYIRELLSDIYTQDIANDITIQYGGSVKPSNAKELLGQPNIDGALVGGASLKAEDFCGIIEAGS